MAEQVDLATPQTTAYFRIKELVFSIAKKEIYVELVGQNGEEKRAKYDATTTPTGATLLGQINTSDNRTVSMIKKVYNRLILDGYLTGTVSGTPD